MARPVDAATENKADGRESGSPSFFYANVTGKCRATEKGLGGRNTSAVGETKQSFATDIFG